jgi:hypothetical protein
VQTQLLTKYPSDQLSVYAIWLRMLVRNSSDEWDEAVMPDLRVQHFWDGELEAAQWFARHVDGYEGTAWDVYYLYGPDAIWEIIPTPLVDSGGTIYRERQALKLQVSTLLGQ